MAKTTFTVKKENLEVVLDRVFDATPEAIWKIISDPTMIPQWWGPAKYPTVVDKMDFRVGGEWRFIQKDNGQEFAFHGVYKEIIPAQKVTDTFNFSARGGSASGGEPTFVQVGHELVETMVFTDAGDGKTKMTTTTKYQNIEAEAPG